ncbi:MAG TPA: transporter substrate-binding domain-containing protein [Rhodanobacter sp.]
MKTTISMIANPAIRRSATMLAIGSLVLSAAITAPPAYAAAPVGGHVLKVCADPNYLPYSNRNGKGFENDIAKYVAGKLGATVDYTWADSRGHGGYPEYLSRNLDSGQCDVVMNMPYGNQEELTTDPYYVSSYVFISRKAKGYNLGSLDAPDLHKLKIGFESDTPVEEGLQLRDLVTTAKAYDIGGHSGVSPRSVLEDVENGTLDVMITWQPAVGAYLKDFPDLTISALPNTRAFGAPEMYSFPMSMAVRKNDQALKSRLDALIKNDTPQLQSILKEHGVQLFGQGDQNVQGDTAAL